MGGCRRRSRREGVGGGGEGVGGRGGKRSAGAVGWRGRLARSGRGRGCGRGRAGRRSLGAVGWVGGRSGLQGRLEGPCGQGRTARQEEDTGHDAPMARAGPPTPTTGSAGCPRQIAPHRDDARLHKRKCHHRRRLPASPTPHRPGSLPLRAKGRSHRGPARPVRTSPFISPPRSQRRSHPTPAPPTIAASPGAGRSTPTAAACLVESSVRAKRSSRESAAFATTNTWRDTDFAWRSPANRDDARNAFGPLIRFPSPASGGRAGDGGSNRASQQVQGKRFSGHRHPGGLHRLADWARRPTGADDRRTDRSRHHAWRPRRSAECGRRRSWPARPFA